MKKQLFSTLLFACSLTTLTAQTPVYLDDTQPIEARVKDALNRMTLEEKVALCHAQSKFSSPGVPRLGIPELWMSDGPHGVRAEINWNDWGYAKWTNDSITAFPALTCLAATWNPEMSAIYGKAIGEEARYREKDVLLGPGVNIYRTPLNGRNFEYMGEDQNHEKSNLDCKFRNNLSGNQTEEYYGNSRAGAGVVSGCADRGSGVEYNCSKSNADA